MTVLYKFAIDIDNNSSHKYRHQPLLGESGSASCLLKPGFHYPSTRPVLTCNGNRSPVNSGSGNRALLFFSKVLVQFILLWQFKSFHNVPNTIPPYLSWASPMYNSISLHFVQHSIQAVSSLWSTRLIHVYFCWLRRKKSKLPIQVLTWAQCTATTITNMSYLCCVVWTANTKSKTTLLLITVLFSYIATSVLINLLLLLHTVFKSNNNKNN